MKNPFKIKVKGVPLWKWILLPFYAVLILIGMSLWVISRPLVFVSYLVILEPKKALRELVKQFGE